MAARTIWNGAISFGLVQIPVGLYSAESTDDLHFRLLDRRNLAPVKYERVNSETGETVPYPEIVKGYEYSKGEFVVLTPEDLKNANVEATQTIDIVQFVDAAEIAPYQFDRPYYLAPQKKGAKAYALLREVLRKSGKVGIAKVVIRTRQHIAALLVEDDVLVLNLLRYAHELRDYKDLDLPSTNLQKAGVTGKELQMAEMLVEQLVEPWDPAKYHDDYRDDLMDLIERKHETGETAVIHPEAADRSETRRAKVIDIMSLLQKSIAEKNGAAREKPQRKGKVTKKRSRGRARGGAGARSRAGRAGKAS